MSTGTPAAPATTATATTPAAPATTAGTLATPAPAATAPVTATTATTTETVNPGSWMAGFNDDLKGYVGNKGFKDASAVVDAYRNLEKLQGVPQDRLLKLPESFYDDKGNLTNDGRAIYERLGAPKEAKDYGIEVPKEGGDPKLMEHFTKIFHEAGIPKGAAQKIVNEWNNLQAANAKSFQEAQAAEHANQVAKLDAEWGAAKEQNTQFAREGMKKMGMTAQQVDALSATLGHAETMKLLSNMGKATGEGSFVSGKPGTTSLEPANAASRIKELMSDKEFGAKLMNGDAEAKATWERLHKQAFLGTITV